MIYDNTTGELKPLAGSPATRLQRMKDEIADIVNVYGAKNFIKYPFTSSTTTSHGITFTDNGDGTITVEGVADADVGFALCSRNINNDLMRRIGVGEFILTGCPSGGSTNTYCIDFGYGNSSSYVGRLGDDIGNGVTCTVTSEMLSYNGQITIIVKNGTDLSTPITFKPMLRMANIEDDTWQPYTQTNKELTKEKVSYKYLGEVGAKNLIPYPHTITNSFTQDGVTYTENEDGSVTLSGTYTGNDVYYYEIADYFNNNSNFIMEKGKRYKYTQGTNSIAIGNGKAFSYAQWRVGSSGSYGYSNVQLDGSVFIPSGTIDLDFYPADCYIEIQVGAVFDPAVTIYPMLRLAEDTDETYQPYAMTNKELTDRAIKTFHMDNAQVDSGGYCALLDDANGEYIVYSIAINTSAYIYSQPWYMSSNGKWYTTVRNKSTGAYLESVGIGAMDVFYGKR